MRLKGASPVYSGREKPHIPPPVQGRGSSTTGIRPFLVVADDSFRSSCLMTQQLLMRLPGRPGLAHEEGTIVHARTAGLVQFRPVRARWISDLLCLDKYHPTTSKSFATYMGHLASNVKPLVYRVTTGLGEVGT